MIKKYLTSLVLILSVFSSVNAHQINESRVNFLSPAQPYLQVTEPRESELQISIPQKMRIPNRTGTQCVWCSIETIGRFSQIKSLYDLTYNPSCKSYANPNSASIVLKKKKVKYKMISYGSGDFNFFKKYVQQEKNPCTFGIHTTHMMTMIHYSEEEGIVRFIDNSDPTLKVRTYDMAKFRRAWDGWAIVVFGNRINDSIINKMPIMDATGKLHHKKNYIILP